MGFADMVQGFGTPEARWARFGPYYAMFPLDFAFEVVEQFSRKGDFIIDPFAGRCSSIYAGGLLGRHSLGIEINPVGWLYGSVKLRPAKKEDVLERLHEIYRKRNYYRRAIEQMPLFYRMCYCDEVLKFLLAARRYLNWESDRVDSTLMSIILVCLHGRLGEGMSNQMKATKAMGAQYSINWWKKNGLVNPPQINPLAFMTRKIEWRYGKGTPRICDSRVVLGDSTVELKNIVRRAKDTDIRFSLLFTSPPYCSITDYYADQWLRLWMLGGPEIRHSTEGKYKGRFIGKQAYYNMLDEVFGCCALLMKRNSTVYVRTDKRPFTFECTLGILQKHFPRHSVKIADKPFTKRTQTEIFGNSSGETGEVDIVMSGG